jgi:hypothetical protein
MSNNNFVVAQRDKISNTTTTFLRFKKSMTNFIVVVFFGLIMYTLEDNTLVQDFVRWEMFVSNDYVYQLKRFY